MFEPIDVTPVGVVRNEVKQAADDIWGAVVSRIELDPSRFTSESLAGLDQFSHVEIIFHMHGVPQTNVQFKARHPRERTDYPLVGIFAQRGRVRPNRLGATICRLVAVHDLAIEVEALDAIDGTPVVDIKPYMAEFGPRGDVRQPDWSADLMATYWSSRA